MPYALSRFAAGLPKWGRLIVAGCVALLGTAATLALLAVVAQGADDFQPFGLRWQWLSLGLFALLSLPAGVLVNVLSQRYLDWEGRQVSLGEFFRNHDLGLLLGQSIGMLLRATAADAAVPPADADLLYRLARRAETDWPRLAASDTARRHLSGIDERRLPDLVQAPDRAALSQAQTLAVLALLNPDDSGQPPRFTSSGTETLVRERLAARLAESVRQALKRDFARRGQAAYALLLDVLSDLIRRTDAFVPRDQADNAAALAAIRAGLDQWPARLDALDADLKARLAALDGALGRGLEGLRQAVQADGDLTRTSVDDLKQQLAGYQAELLAALAPKQAGEDPTQRQLPPELLDKARELLARGDREQQAVGMIPLHQHDAADQLIQDLKREPLAEAFRLLTLEGDNWYNAGAFDRALGPYEQALALRPEDPSALNNVATAHAQARLGDIAAHRQQAIHFLNKAQRAWTWEADQEKWASIQSRLGVAWHTMPTGDRAANLKMAIEAYTAASIVYTRGAYPLKWAAMQSNIGEAWRQMPTGDPSENLKRAIEAYNAALYVRTREVEPDGWAKTQHNLGIAWSQMHAGNRAENLQRAIDAYTRALTVHTREAYPVYWAMIQNNLGEVFREMPTGDRADNLGRAIAAYGAAIEIHTRDAYPEYWAGTQNNLGEAWRNMPHGNRAENLRRATDAYREALKVYTRDAHPEDWAMTRFNLGLAYWDRAELADADTTADLTAAIAEIRAAAEVWTATDFPIYRQRHIAPNLEALRAAWLAGAHGSAADFDAIAPAR